jgi:1,2-diacylglycerol 3-beta-glucosyltransferase
VFSALVVIELSLGLTYFLVMMCAGLRVIAVSRAASGHRRRDAQHGESVHPPWRTGAASWVRRRGHQVRRRLSVPEGPVPRAVTIPPRECVVYFLVPCLNEEAVIHGTVRGLLSDPRARVVVIDDGSDDDTGLAGSVDPDRVNVVRRELPNARTGKGPALNDGFAEIVRDASDRGIATSRIIVCVMDADGRLSPRALDAVLPLFADGRVGGVQLPVRIRNRGSLLTLLQDLEFWGLSAVSQLGRTLSGTVSLGGNGQFTRLSALLGLGRDPWQQCLTEDLDLALALLAAGWRLESTRRANVSQQAITTLEALIRQRTRWFQGHMESGRWLRQLWSSPSLSHVGLLEITMYLAVPWVLVLPWSIIFHYSLLTMILGYSHWGIAEAQFGSGPVQVAIGIIAWYFFSLLPSFMAGYLYYRQDRRTGLLKSLALGHLLLLANYIAYVACWRALYRIATGRKGWDKTARNAEAAGLSAPAAPVPVTAGAVPAGIQEHPARWTAPGDAESMRRPASHRAPARRRSALRPFHPVG